MNRGKEILGLNLTSLCGGPLPGVQLLSFSPNLLFYVCDGLPLYISLQCQPGWYVPRQNVPLDAQVGIRVPNLSVQVFNFPGKSYPLGADYDAVQVLLVLMLNIVAGVNILVYEHGVEDENVGMRYGPRSVGELIVGAIEPDMHEGRICGP